MTFEEFLYFVPDKCEYETIYIDNEGRLILVVNMVDAYSMVNKMVKAEREACAVAAERESLRGLPEEQPEGEALLCACAQIAGGVLIADAIRARGQS